MIVLAYYGTTKRMVVQILLRLTPVSLGCRDLGTSSISRF